ncbi:MAG: transglutaminase family protein [Ilumatobacteraceae bacterium]|jgi:regulator of sirC expression with transglutaminase-like and TPR domain
MEPAVRFAALVSGPPTALQLDVACCLMSAAFTGRYEQAKVLGALDQLASQVEQRTLEGVVDVVRRRLTGARDNYYDPRNSFIDEVLERGEGLPITLSVILIEVGRRVEVPIVGVGLPGHFIVRDATRDVYADPFNDGAVFDRAGLVARWRGLVGDGHAFDELHLAPVTERAILIRMLNNLRALYIDRDDPRALYALSIMRGGFAELAHEAPQHARWVRHLN